MEKNVKKLNGYYLEESDDEYEQTTNVDPMKLTQFINQRTQVNLRNKDKFEKEKKLHIELLKKIRSKELQKTGYVLNMWLSNVNPKFYRKFVVPGKIFLCDLKDRVICPIWGLCRNYHGHYFKKLPFKRDFYNIGEVYGPEKAGFYFVDLMHCPVFGIKMINDEEVMLCDVLKSEKERMLFQYDLGDKFEFKIEVKELVKLKYNGEIYLLEGVGCSIPEDGEGNFSFAKHLRNLSKKNKDYEESLDDLNGSINYERNNESFPIDFTKFDLLRFQKILQMSIRTDRLCPQMTKCVLPVNTAQYNHLRKGLKKCCCCTRKVQKMKKCSNCKITFYCGKSCQAKHWSQHKKTCRKMKMNDQKKSVPFSGLKSDNKFVPNNI